MYIKLEVRTIEVLPRDPPGRAGGSVREEGSLGVPAQTAAAATRPRINGRKWMDGWIENHQETRLQGQSLNQHWECPMELINPSTLSCYEIRKIWSSALTGF